MVYCNKCPVFTSDVNRKKLVVSYVEILCLDFATVGTFVEETFADVDLVHERSEQQVFGASTRHKCTEIEISCFEQVPVAFIRLDAARN